MPELDALPLSANNPVKVGDIVRFRWAGPTDTCHLVQMIHECDCPHFGPEPLHLHFICVRAEAGTWKHIPSGQTYLGGYRYEGDRLMGRNWPEGSNAFKTNGGERDELFLVWRKPVLETVQAAVEKGRAGDPNTTLTLEGW